eukprot:7318895-Prymnesium_polylepis.3
MIECFIQVALAKYPLLNDYKKYTIHRGGTLSSNLKHFAGAQTNEESISFGEVVAEVELLQRKSADENEDLEAAPAEAEGEEEEEEEEDDDDDDDGDDDDE